ncbi:MAG: histidinol-phosphate transaminase [Ichthyobacteriaceae bacterium]|nr:histidinol-phosphate transaminase [Ichthyobacteriaceae bacterium]
MEHLVRENIKALKPYSSARDEFKQKAEVYLDANENPYNNSLNRYPDPYQKDVKKLISEWRGVSVNKMMLGNGSDEVLDLIYRAFVEPKQDNAIQLPPTYGMYDVLANINNVELRSVGLNDDFSLDIDAILEAQDNNSKLLFVCSPNNPTANVFDISKVEKLLKEFNGVVVIDEAYIDFAEGKSWVDRLDEFPNLIVTQTFSKALGHAAIRLGIAYASEYIISVLNKIKPPYNVNELTQRRALEVLNKRDFYLQIKAIKEEREKLNIELLELTFVEKVYPSEANFILIKVDDANKRYDELLAQGIVIRNRSTQYKCENTLRISIGTPDENEILIKAMNKLV